MKRILILICVLFLLTACAQTVEEELDEPVILEEEVVQEPVIVETTPEPEPVIQEADDTPVEQSFTPGQDTPSRAVQSYVYYITKARQGDDTNFGKALDYLSPILKDRTIYTRNFEAFVEEFDKQVNEWGNDGTLLAYSKEVQFGDSYKVYFETSDGEMFFTSDFQEGKWYVYSASKRGGLFWPMESADGFQ